ncbi:MAG TPA: AI-2E family transporter [Candidatus Limnocylindrales bacterium]|nr:AI-2E family transporter [Candidatus Limnocylindrales bacterium]
MTVTKTPSPPTWDVVPPWLRNAAAISWRIVVSVLLAAVLIAVATALSVVTASVLISVIVAATFAPFVLGLRNRGWSRTAAAAAVTAGALIVVLGTLLLITLAFVPYLPDVSAWVRDGVADVQGALADASIPPETVQAIGDASTQIEAAIGAAAAAIVGALANAATIGILALFLTFFFLQDGDKAWGWAFQATAGRARERIWSAGNDALDRVGGYLRGTAILAATDAISDFVFLWLLGVPLAAPLAVLVFFGGFIPYVGGFITTTVLVLVTLASNGPRDVIILLVLITIMNLIQGNLLSPIVYGKTVNIHPALVLVALPAGAALGGILGLFAAIPLVAMVLAVAGAVVTILDPGPEYEPPALVPGWLDRLAQWSWRLLVLFAVVYLGLQILLLVPTVAISVVLGVVFAATFRPMVLALVRRGWRRGPSAALATGGAFLLVLVIVVLAALSLVDQGAQIATTVTSGAETANDAAGGMLGPLVEAASSYGAGFVAAISGAVSSLATLAVILILSGLLCFYFLLDGEKFWRRLQGRIRPDRSGEVDAAANRALGVLSGYMVGTGAISLFGAVTQYIIMVVLGLPLALPLAVLAFFGGFIPYIGSFIVTGLAFLVAVAVGSTQDVAIMAVYTIVINVVQGNFVAPLVYSRAVNLHPAVVLMAIPAGSAVAGVLGMFLAVPFLGVIAATWRTVPRAFATNPDAEPGTPGLRLEAAAPPAELTPATEPGSS